MDLTIVIPCYNEAANAGVLEREFMPVVAQLRATRRTEVLFVDDGSTDGTGDLLSARFGSDPELRVLRHDGNRGLGAALRTGFNAARGEIIVTTDSDATYDFSLIPLLLDRLHDSVDI